MQSRFKNFQNYNNMGQQAPAPVRVGGKVSNENTGWKNYEKQLNDSRNSEVPPYSESQIKYLENIFNTLDVKNIKTIQFEQLDQIYFLKEHPLYERIRMLFEQEVKKLKIKRLGFDIVLHLLSVFHFRTDIQAKYKYLFRLYDWDKDFKLSSQDLIKTFGVLFKGQVYDSNCLTAMAAETMQKYGSRGQIKFQNFRVFIPQGELQQLMTFRFNSSV